MGKKIDKRILIAGLGNLLFRDEGIGVHIIKEISKKELPENVELIEIGTAIFELVSLMEGKDKIIIVDAILSDEEPGTIYKLTADELKTEKVKHLTSLYQFSILEAINSSAQIGIKPEIVIFGITPKDYKNLGLEITPELKEVMPKIVDLILKEIKSDL